jgi:ribonuclease HII
MRSLHRRFREFCFDTNKGYGTPEHRAALDRLGPTPVHRLSFAGVGQVSLFAEAPGTRWPSRVAGPSIMEA